jgi:hypothetical protein
MAAMLGRNRMEHLPLFVAASILVISGNTIAVAQSEPSTKLSIGSYAIGMTRDITDAAPSSIYSTNISDSGNSRDIIYIFDTARLIRTTYPKINSKNFETSKEFISMYHAFVQKFGKPSKVSESQPVMNSEHQFGKSLKKSWIWKFPDGQVQMIAITALVDKEMLRYFARAQAQQYQKTDYRYRGRVVSDVEGELYYGMTQALSPSTQIQLKIWGNITGDRVGFAMVKCVENPDACQFSSAIELSTKGLSDIDAPASWYQLSNGFTFDHKGSRPVMGQPIDFPRKGIKKKRPKMDTPSNPFSPQLTKMLPVHT